MDLSGEQHINIHHNIYKRRLDMDGRPIDDPERQERKFFLYCIFCHVGNKPSSSWTPLWELRVKMLLMCSFWTCNLCQVFMLYNFPKMFKFVIYCWYKLWYSFKKLEGHHVSWRYVLLTDIGHGTKEADAAAGQGNQTKVLSDPPKCGSCYGANTKEDQ